MSMSYNVTVRKPGGNLIIDHRASPGLPADFYRKLGYPDMPVATEGKMVEMDTLTCAHCPNVFIVNPKRTRERAFCQKCGGHYICDICALNMKSADYIHRPFKKLVDDTINSEYRKTQNGNLFLPLITEKSPNG